MRRRLRGTAKRPLKELARRCRNVLHCDAERAGMADRTGEMRTWPAGDVVCEHPMALAVERRPASYVAAGSDHDASRAHRRGDMRHAGVIADEKGAFMDPGRQRPERRFAG